MNKKNKKGLNQLIAVSVILSVINFTSCRKLVESPLPTEYIAETSVYSTDATAIAVLNSLYTDMNGPFQPFQGVRSIGLLAGLSSDELTLYGGITAPPLYSYYTNSLSQVAVPASGAEHWSSLYNYIFKCNAAIEGLNKSTSLSQKVKQQLLGETKFMRSFFYFYLVNLFGDVPLVLTTDPKVNTLLTRNTKDQVYQQIIGDLKQAEELLSSDYLSGTLLSTTTERVRPTKWAATALLARVYLYAKEYDKAEERATVVINNTSLFGPISTVPLNAVFLKNSKEAIWQLQPTAQYFNTQEAQALIIPPQGPGSNQPVYLSKQWLSNFEAGDQRKLYGNWIDTTIYTVTQSPLVRDTLAFCYKYKKNEQNLNIVSTPTVPAYTLMNEYFMVLRLGEQYLIRAEARAHQGKITEAQQDLNVIRTRAVLPNTTASDQSSLITAILKERQVELFCEWGHRWLDLKRTNKVDEVMTISTPLKSNGATTWQSYQQLYPLPIFDLDWGPNLKQNSGY